MMDRSHSALNPGENAHKHNLTSVTYHVVELRCGDCALAQRPTHIAFTQMLFYCRLLSCCSSTSSFTHKHTLFFSFSLYFCIFIGLFSPSLISPSRSGEQKRCPLCEVIFPPHYDQSKFEEHVESHWKICPLCGEQFHLDCDQELFEKHVLTHFDSNMINF